MALNILAPLLSFLGLIVVVAGIVYFVMRVRAGEPLRLSFQFLLTLYFYIVSIASLLVLVVGLTGLVRAGLSLPLGQEFSYLDSSLYYRYEAPGGVPEKGREPITAEQLRLRMDQAFREGILQGVSLSLVGGLVWGLHYLGRRRREALGGDIFLVRAYPLLLLVIFSVVGLISAPMALYETLRFYLVPPPEELWMRSAPGESLATAIVFVPFWVYYLLTFLRRVKGETA